MICPACQTGVPDNAKFCPFCGVALPQAPSRERRELRKTVTILFCDMTDSTALSGRLDPESLREVMVRYFALMRDCLERHGGTVEKFIGDAVMAVFGVPVLHEDDPQRALRAAVEMIRGIRSLNDELRTLIGVEIGVRIGVNTGEVIAAEDASSGQALAAGEAVNVAARLQTHAGPGQVVVGPVTRTLAEAEGTFAALGALTLKGVAEPMPAWRLVRLGHAGRVPDTRTPFFGRATELDQLVQLLGSTRSSGFRLVTLYGEPGVGKTRLAVEFAAKAAGSGALVGVGRCQPYGEGTPLHALGEALRQVVAAARDRGALALIAGSDSSEALGYLEAGLLRDGSPGEQPGQLAWALAEVLTTLAPSGPVLLVVDDLQAAKPVLLNVLAELASRVTSAAVLVLGVARPELVEESPWWDATLPDARLVPLGPLSADEARLLVAAVSEVTPHHAAPALAEQIVERAGGNPFFLEQLAAIADQTSTDTLPATVRLVIAARLDLLRPAEQDVLLRAAVPGVRFSTSELGALLLAEPAITSPSASTLGTLTRRRLIEPTEAVDAYRFSGVLIRDVAYHTLSKRDRLRYHEALASWYRENSAGQDLVGLHLERAYRLAADLHPADIRVTQLRIDAARALASSGELALRHSDLHWAADLLAQAFDLDDEDSPQRIPVGVHLAEARLLLGADPLAQQNLRTLAGQASAGGDQRTAAHARLLLAAMELPRPSSADEALATVPVFEAAGDDLGLSRAWLRLAQLGQLSGRYGDAQELLRRALRHALGADAHLELATAIGGLATSLWRGPTPAPVALTECRALLAEYAVGRRAVRATVNCPHAVLLAYVGEHDLARSLVRTSARIIAELGHAYGAAMATVFAATLEGLAGQWDAAEELLRDIVETSRNRGDPLSYAAAVAGLARARIEQGKDAAALDVAAEAGLTGDPYLDADVCGVRARALATNGAGDQALAEAERACAVAETTDSLPCQATAQLDRAHVLRALGNHAGAAVAAAAAGRLFREKGHLVGVARVASFRRIR